jgi:antitoxin (DNA-binding transcriptional repressor) of toxin-antitoxin stability system
MEKATISELKNQLSAYLKKVRSGQTILIYDRDEPIARLEAVTASTAQDDHLIGLERAGLVRRGRGPMPLDLLRAPAPRPKRSVVEALLEERREGR